MHASEGGESQLVSRRERLIVLSIGTFLVAALTYPTITQLRDRRSLDSGDGRFSIWNVAWVAHALVDDPRRSLRRQHFLPASADADVFRAESRRRGVRRAHVRTHAQSAGGPQHLGPDCAPAHVLRDVGTGAACPGGGGGGGGKEKLGSAMGPNILGGQRIVGVHRGGEHPHKIHLGVVQGMRMRKKMLALKSSRGLSTSKCAARATFPTLDARRPNGPSEALNKGMVSWRCDQEGPQSPAR